ncbi:hypothetical protein V2J09_013825 [Rumex salicifolius]
MFKIEENVWDSEAWELEKMVVDYFRNPYMIDENSLTRRPLSLSRMEFEYLEKPFTREEIENAIRSMGRFKAPCPDGFQPIFYQQCWDVVGESVIRFVLDFFETRILPWSMNDALLVLIVKVSKPERISQFRPISLCNVLFKTITKAMVNHLKSVIAKLIGLIQEAGHSMQRRCLSIAARITLTKVVLPVIPIHTMSVIKLPERTLNSINIIAHDFVWGSSLE